MRQRRMYAITETEEFEGQSIPFQVPLHALVDSQSEYANYPDFQRDGHIWPERYEYELIKTLVLRGYVPPILVCKRLDGKPGKWVIDGQQRLQTMLRFVAALKADLAHKPIPRDETGSHYFYFRISQRQQELLLSSMIKFEELQKVTPSLLARTFLSLQNQVSATTAEKLWASPSKLNSAVKDVYNFSPFFQEVYTGRTRRKQPFQMAAYPVIIEMFKPFTDLDGSRLKLLMDGRKDSLVHDGIEDRVIDNLAHASRLFEGVKVAAMTEAIIMYQCVWLLKFIGCNLEETRTRALTPWYRTIEKLNAESRAAGFMNLFAQFVNRKTQMHYWRSWIEDIVYGNLIAGGQETAVLAQMQRLTGWLRQDGICEACKEQHVQLTDMNKHVFRPADNQRPEVCRNVKMQKIGDRVYPLENNAFVIQGVI